MKPAAYRDIPPEDIPALNLTQGGRVKVIAGTVQIENQTLVGPIQGLSTEPLFLDVQIQSGDCFTLPVPENHNAFIYAYEGNIMIGGEVLFTHTVGVFCKGDEIFHFSSKMIFGQLLETFGDFLLVTLVTLMYLKFNGTRIGPPKLNNFKCI